MFCCLSEKDNITSAMKREDGKVAELRQKGLAFQDPHRGKARLIIDLCIAGDYLRQCLLCRCQELAVVTGVCIKVVWCFLLQDTAEVLCTFIRLAKNCGLG